MMKRGFLDWDEKEISRDELLQRREKVLARMQQEKLDYLLVYGDISQCDNVHYLSHFNTYTRDCLLIVGKEGTMSLVSSLTLRDREWIANVTPVASRDIYFAAGLVKASDVLKKVGFSGGRIGLVGEYFPRALHEHLTKELPQSEFFDLSNWFRELRRVKDAGEVRLVKRAALLAASGAQEVDGTALFGKKESVLSARAEWIIRSRGGEDYYFLCSSGKKGYLDRARDVKVETSFAFALLTQYKGCWAWLARSVWSQPAADGGFAAYQKLVSAVQSEGNIESLENCIDEAKKSDWRVEMKSPVGTDAESSIIPGLESVPKQQGALFTLAFTKDAGDGFAIYGETIHVGADGYEVLTHLTKE